MSEELVPHEFQVFTTKDFDEKDAILKRVLLIVNPKSGLKKGLRICRRIVPILHAGGCETQIVYTEYGGHAKVLAREYDLSQIDVFAPIGGDGTVHESINGFMERADFAEVCDRVAIGIIPGGSGNTLAYDAGLLSPIIAANAIVAGSIRRFDVHKVTPLERSSDKDDSAEPGTATEPPVYSVNIVGYGFPANVLQKANALRCFGGAQYEMAAYLTLIKNQGYKCRIEMVNEDGTTVVREDKYIMIQGQLTVHMGSRVPFCVNAKLDDGLIDLVLIKHAGRRDLVKTIQIAKKGRIAESPLVEEFQVRSFKVLPLEQPVMLQGPRSVNVDGELDGYAPFEATVLPRALRFVCP
mmetsp:Transcript_2207/g.5083  ORF Transcript_2207/g.5083 Transcript_2207/m.5083 type:complete len:353 (+) Transcript_2207:568-1626(+)|eukprot:CAMPEP_0171516294 /NCGR_PEP_ID=MMETSP0959-20130129/3955_1 /TAXON_ID=87120 /ORGANISM="Aurantiochytrium limacinum, Strain ATCCMYA-1381" /LENGTH=352 /DNA_ID=CAMNT_0012054985 /DNA_START=507 /DNA_END=1565 /DNA_ORIENTATION=-